MNIQDFIESKGVKEVSNPNYNPKSKKNNEPATIVVNNLLPDNSMIADLIRQDLTNNESLPYEQVEKYIEHNVNPTFAGIRSGSIDKELADAQSGWEQFGRALAQTVVSEIIYGTIGSVGDLWDMITGKMFQPDNNYQNPVSSYFENLQEEFRKNHEIYQDPTKTGWADWSDSGWWFNQFPSIMSSLTLLIPGAGVAKGATTVARMLGKGLRATAKFARTSGRALKVARRAEEVGKIGKFENWINRPSVIAKADRYTGVVASAITQRHLENYQEGRQVFKDMYDNTISALSDMTPEEREAFYATNEDIFTRDGVDINDDAKLAHSIAKRAADRTYMFDAANLVFDIYQTATLGNVLKMPKSLRATRAVNKAQRESKIFARYGKEQGLKKLAERSKGAKVKDWLKDGSIKNSLIYSELSEGAEEAINYVAQQEGMSYGKTLLDGSYNGDLSDRLASYLRNSEFYESAFWGVLGGVVFQGAGSYLRRTKNATVSTIKQNRNYNEETKEGKKASWKDLFLFTEGKKRAAEIESRFNNLELLRSRYNQIYGETSTSPFSYDVDENGNRRILTNDIEKADAWQRALDEYITQQYFSSAEHGNYDLFKEYLRDPNVKEVFESLGNAENRIDTEALIEKMDKLDEMYSNELITIDDLSAVANNDVTEEYISIIARDNVANRLTIERLDNKIKRYEESAAANEFRLKDELAQLNYNAAKQERASILENLTYKDAVDIVTATNYLTQLQNKKYQIESDKEYKGSLSGQIELKQLNKAISQINEYINKKYNDGSVFGLATTLFTNFHSLNENSNEFLDLQKHIASGNVKGAIGVLNDAKLTQIDDAIVDNINPNELFGTNSDGLFHLMTSRFKEHFGVEAEVDENGKKKLANKVSKFEEKLPALAEDYKNIAALNLSRYLAAGRLVTTRDSVSTAISTLHNFMNEARLKAISTARNTIVEMAKKYGRQEVYDYVFNGKEITNITPEDKRSLDDAVTVLNLTSETNADLVSMIQTAIMLGDYERNVVRPNTPDDSEESTSPVGNGSTATTTTNPATTNPTSTNPMPKPTPTPKQNPAPTPAPTPTSQTHKIRIISDPDTGVNFAFVDAKQNTNDDVRFRQTVTQNGTEYELLVADNQNNKAKQKRLASNSFLFDGYDKTNTGILQITENPIVLADANGNMTVVRKGKVEYVKQASPANQRQPKGNSATNPTANPAAKPTPTPTPATPATEETVIPPEGNDENPAAFYDGPVLSPEEEAKEEQKIDFRIKVQLASFVVKKQGGTKEDMVRAAQEAAAEAIDELRNGDGLLLNEDDIQECINWVYKKHDLLEVAMALNNVKQLRFSTIEENVSSPYAQEYIDAVYNLVKTYAEACHIDAVNGQYYINFEDFIRNINLMYDGEYQGEEVYADLKAFFASKFNEIAVITDDLNDDELLSNARKSFETRTKERIGSRDSYRVQILTDDNNENDEDRTKAFNQLKVGDNVSVKFLSKQVLIRGGEFDIETLLLFSGDVAVGRMPVPERTGRGFRMYNLGWLTHVDKNGNSALKDYFKQLSADEQVNAYINKLLYDDTLNLIAKHDIELALLNRFQRDVPNLISDRADPAELIRMVLNLWRYKLTNADFSQNVANRIAKTDYYLDLFFTKLYDSYEAIDNLAATLKYDKNKTVTATVSKINDGELIRNVELSEEELKNTRQAARNNYDKFTQSSEAFPNDMDVKVGAVDGNGRTLLLENGERIDHTALGTTGTVHVLVPNRSGKVNFAIATGVRVFDSQLDKKSDAFHIIDNAKQELNKVVKDFAENPTDLTKWKALRDTLTGLFGYTGNQEHIDGLFYGWAAGYENKGFYLQRPNTVQYLKIYDANSVKKGTFLYNDGTKEKATAYSIEDNAELLVTAINDCLDTCAFSLAFSHLKHKAQFNGYIGYRNDSNGVPKFVIKVNNKEFVYNSLSEAYVKGGLLRVNTRLENGSNYRAKGKEQGANRVLEISSTFTIEDNTESGTQINDEEQTQEQEAIATKPTDDTGEAILNNNDANDAVTKLVQLALPSLTETNLKNLKDLGLLPTSIIFAEQLTDNDNNDAIAAHDVDSGNTTVTRRWLDMFDGRDNGNHKYSSAPIAYRQQAIRKLIHEQVHRRIAIEDKGNQQLSMFSEPNTEKTIDRIKSIYNEFKDYLAKQNDETKNKYSKYLFNDKQDENERYEEFLVESITSKELSEYLNTIETSYEEGELDADKAKTKTIWDKIISLIARIFNYDFAKNNKTKINKNSLLQKELYALSGAFTKKEAAPVEAKPRKVRRFNLGNNEANNKYSTIDEVVTDSNGNQERRQGFLSEQSMLAAIPASAQPQIARMIATGEISTVCR